ncbi:MAG: winged helix-turn-helix transcriptional regulator [Candidatus Aminicenantes bacterium]|nr:winged helix-turn-helix transcriptional regulator [Candidatus Aminicenantes bacterium]
MNGMDEETQKTLQILEEVSKDHQITQRTLSEHLGVALGRTNLYLKRLVRKGLIKVKGIPGKRYFYYLTPVGFSEKAILSIRYIQNSWHYYQALRNQWGLFFMQLQENGVGRVLIYGTDEMAELALFAIQESEVHVVGFIDQKRCSSSLLGQAVYSFSDLPELEYDRIILTPCLLDPETDKPIRSSLVSRGVDGEKIIGLNAEILMGVKPGRKRITIG